MKKFERVKVFESSDIHELENQYNGWFKERSEFHASVPALRGIPFTIVDRVMCVRNYDGEETYVLSIFYEHYELESFEQGPDRGAGRKIGGASIFGRK